MRRTTLALVCAGCGLATMAALWLGAWLAPGPATLDAAVALAPRDRGVPYREVRVEEARCVPAWETCLRYIADVEVLGERPARGRLACARPVRGCELWLPELGLHGAPVPDPAPPGRPAWLEGIFRAAKGAMRAWR
ncbi:MAG TPA: hypothetical protein VNL77_25425 [Roseiflexaceae bacterium]|nr:hypothetical protein [Roseiflexaceae bacterium]